MSRPSPAPTALTQPFFDACARGELLYQRCDACGRAQFYPRGHCAHCHATTLQWRASARRGEIFTFTRVERAPTAAFKAMVPYVIALVQLDEGFRIMTNVIESALEGIRIGSRVEIVFRPADNGIVMPQARLLE